MLTLRSDAVLLGANAGLYQISKSDLICEWLIMNLISFETYQLQFPVAECDISLFVMGCFYGNAFQYWFQCNSGGMGSSLVQTVCWLFWCHFMYKSGEYHFLLTYLKPE